MEPHRTPPVQRDQQELGRPPLDSYETILNYASTTRTSTGLKVNSHLVKTDYPKGVKVNDQQMEQLRLRPHDTQPTRNYTVSPR